MGDVDVQDVIELERSLLSPETRRSARRVEQLLDPGFQEIGASGRVWTRSETAAALAEEPAAGPGTIRADEMVGTTIAPGLVLVTYVSARDGRRVRRTSLWRRRGGAWLMLHHQGTPLDAVPADPAGSTSR